jgi:predicted DNA-binding transcriptional regulator AlpA
VFFSLSIGIFGQQRVTAYALMNRSKPMKSQSIDEWCKAHGLSRSFFYLLQQRGEGPRSFKVGRVTRISDAANAEWVAAREAASQSVAA